MKTKELGRTGVSVSAIGFGGMPLSTAGRPDRPQALRVIESALDAGITLLDTADVYCLDDTETGHNERLFAEALAGRSDRDSVRIATKGGLRRPKGEWRNDASPAQLRKACEASLQALGVERIFLYQLHAPDPNVPFEKSVETLAELQREGKIEHIGVSNVSLDQLRAAASIVELQVVQNRLNPFFREAVEEGIVAECDARHITFLAYSPVGGGRLAKKLGSFELLRDIARRREATPHAITLGWVRAQGKSVIPIPGSRTVEHVIDSANSIDVKVTPDELKHISATYFSRA